MKTLPVHWTKDSRADLGKIADDIAEATGSMRIAMTYAQRVEARGNQFGLAPHIGRSRDDLFPGLRTVAFERSAVICYVIEDDTVWITNVFRRGCDYEAILRGEPEGDE